jgi:hypothetical protein
VYDIVPDDANYPAAIVLPPMVPDYRDDLAGTGSMSARFPVLLLVPTTVARLQLKLFPYIEKTGTQSIFALVEADRTLGGLNVDARATNVEDFDTTRVGLTTLYGRTVNVDVIVS